MSYDPTTKIISMPVRFYDVQQCLMTGDNDLSTLCRKQNINMWSDIKPVYHTKVIPLTTDDRKGRSLAGYKTGGGIKKRTYGFADYQVNMASNGNPESKLWEHDKPVLDGSCAFRLTDFSGYWHLATNIFRIYSYITNLRNIPIPSTSGGTGGVDIDFMISTSAVSGSILPTTLFGDCMNFYPAVIMTCGYFKNSARYHYVKSASLTLQQSLNQQDISSTIRVNTADFAAAVANDMGIADPYGATPLSSGTNWTMCVALVSRVFAGGTGAGEHRFNDSDTIVRLEYAANVDRWTLPTAQGKYTKIRSMTMTVTLTRRTDLENNNKVYQLTSITITADKVDSDSLTFNVTANLTCHIGSVSMSGVQDPTSANCGSVTFSGTGSQTQTVQIPTTLYTVTGTSVGNMECNGTLVLHNQTIGDFSGGFNQGVNSGNSTYTKTESLV